MKAIFLIFILFTMIWAVTWPVGTKAVIPLTVNHTKIGENATNFCYQKVLLLANDQQFKNAFRSAANITIYDTVTGLIRPSRITYNTKDSVYVYFDGATSTSADKVFFACAGPTINRTNSSAAFTNSNITNYWGLGDSVSPVIDMADANNGTVVGVTLGATGKFGRCVNYTASSQRITIGDVSTLKGAQKFTYAEFFNASILSGAYIHFRKEADATNNLYLRMTSTTIDVYIKNDTMADVATATYTYGGEVTTGNWYSLTIVFDGTQTGNENRLKIFLNGIQKTLTFTNNIPQVTPNTTAPGIFGSSGTSNMLGLFDEPLFGSNAFTSGRISSRYEMVMNPSTFWTQGGSIPVNKSNNNDSRWGAFKRAYRGAFQPAYKPTYK